MTRCARASAGMITSHAHAASAIPWMSSNGGPSPASRYARRWPCRLRKCRRVATVVARCTASAEEVLMTLPCNHNGRGPRQRARPSPTASVGAMEETTSALAEHSRGRPAQRCWGSASPPARTPCPSVRWRPPRDSRCCRLASSPWRCSPVRPSTRSSVSWGPVARRFRRSPPPSCWERAIPSTGSASLRCCACTGPASWSPPSWSSTRAPR